MKKIAVLILAFAMLQGCDYAQIPAGEQNEPESPQEVINDVGFIEGGEGLPLDSIPINRAVVAKMISLAMLSQDEVEGLDYMADFSDVVKDSWYAEYVNSAMNLGYMAGSEGSFYPDRPLSVSEAQILMDKLNPDNKTMIKITDENKNLPISYALWRQLYLKVLTEFAKDKTIYDAYGFSEKDIIVLATPGNMNMLPPWSMITDDGPLFFKGLNMDAYIDKKISVFIKDGEIVAIGDMIDEEPIIENAYISDVTDGNIKVFSGGAQRTYKIGQAVTGLEQVADVKISDGAVISVTGIAEQKKGTIKKITNNYVEFVDGRIDIEGNIPVYRKTDTGVYIKDMNILTAGSKDTVFYLKEGKIAAAVLEKEPVPESMRVLIYGAGSPYHKQVEITATSAYTVITKEGEKKFKEGETLVISSDSNKELFSSDRIFVKPDNEGGRILVSSIKRSDDTPRYRGIIEIAKEGDEYEIVNELPFEQYLYSVVSSQIPAALGAEAAKAQSIVARTVAYNQFYESRFSGYGANVDDISVSQQYNVLPESEISVSAVTETKNKILKVNGEAIRPTFFLASAGYTANAGEVWPRGEEFPTETLSYLRAVKQYREGEFGDLSDEANASQFYKANITAAYENDVSWIRWRVSMKMDEIEASINANINARYSAFPSHIKTLYNGEYVSKAVESIGKISDIKVTKRGKGGNIMELKITSSTGEYLILTESAVKALIRPRQYIENRDGVLLTRADDSKLLNFDTMPSVFYTFDIKEDNGSLTVDFYGGGNGHGVGMSQCGAKALADSGISYEDILKHYFTGCAIENLHVME